jgi:hypothetical protein
MASFLSLLTKIEEADELKELESRLRNTTQRTHFLILNLILTGESKVVSVLN